MPGKTLTEAEREKAVIDQGRRLLLAAERHARGARTVNRWLEGFLDRTLEDENFRIRALRFVDVLPALDDDEDLVRHLDEYFGEEGLPLPGLVSLGIRYIHKGVGEALVARSVRRVMTELARRFVGGATAQEVLGTAAFLRQRNIGFTLDHLGEAVVSEAEADAYQATYLDLIGELADTLKAWPANPLLDRNGERPLPLVNLSIKPSSLYSQIDPLDPEGSIAGIAKRLRPVLLAARKQGAFVCIDMEQYDLKGVILACFKQLLMEPEFRDWPDVGIAIQAYLREAEKDLAGLIEWAKARGTPVTVRLVRGAYWDLETVVAAQQGWPLPVWGKKWQTDACYERCLRLLFQNHGFVEAAVATHNVRSHALAMVLAEEQGLRKDQFEFQMLYGMASTFEDVLPEAGYRLRVYVPFGEILPGMAYLVRRLLENSSSQSFQRLRFTRHLSPGQLLASPHGPSEEAKTAPATPQAFMNEPPRRFTDPTERRDFQVAIAGARRQLGAIHPLVIDGKPVETGHFITSINPARPSEIVGRVAKAGRPQADAAVVAASQGFPDWASRTMAERAEFLLKAAALLRTRRDEFSAYEIIEAGKTWREADANVTEAIDYLTYYAREAIRLGEPRRKDVPGETNISLYRPRGVGLIVPPWNFPLAILTGMLSAAIVAGNTVILKPSSQAPVIAARFIALLREAGLPPGVVQFLPGQGSEIGDYLVRHSQVHFIAFTGSEAVGTRIVRLAAEVQSGQHHVKHVVAEMGGKNAIIVDSDADQDDAVVGVLHSAFGYAGQKCSACSRVIVDGGHYDRFLERMVEAARSLKIGLPEEPGVFLGPVIEVQAKKRILETIERGKQEAELVYQGDCSGLGEGYFIGPAIFSRVPPDSFLAQDEIFGPVVSVMPAKDMDEAIALANRSKYALTGGIYSRSPAHIEQAKRELLTGNLYINRKITGALVERQPFGGFKLSGLGSKAGGPDYLLQFLLPRTITENTLRRGFAPGQDLVR
jgi:RHH-type proline utilization regulon transcriptional repressor/proline dehydrogenase/delta 1-pyrroline-5-carboxylate dehydrogenase